MSQTELPFPRRELTGAQRQQVRDLLVREAASTSRHRRPIRLRVVIPAAAFAVGVAVLGSTLVVDNWHRTGSVAPGSSPAGGECGDTRPAQPAAGPGLTYVAPLPTGMTYYNSRMEQELYCLDGLQPMVTFVRAKKAGAVTAAITVWRSLPPDFDADPKGVAVAVRSRPGRALAGGKLTWTEPDGQRWSVTGSGLSKKQLVSAANGLTLGATVSWPEATQGGFTKLGIPARLSLEDKSWQPIWSVRYDAGPPSTKGITVAVLRVRPPWQTEVAAGTRLVTVAGRPGLLGGDGDASLWTTTATGAQVLLLGSPRSGLVALAENLTLLAPTDPDLHLSRLVPTP